MCERGWKKGEWKSKKGGVRKREGGPSIIWKKKTKARYLGIRYLDICFWCADRYPDRYPEHPLF